MALTDVSRSITLFQRLCQFAEEFTEEHRDDLVAALTNLFRSDLEDGQEGPNVLEMINGLLRRLRSTLVNMTQSETELLGAFKENIAFRDLRDQLLSELRVVFDRARVECRNHFGRPKADAAGFPARIADDSGAILRQTKLVSWMLRKPDFELGESVIPHSVTTADSILEIYEAKAQELETTLSHRVRRRARVRGKQVAKDQQVADFRTTYSIFVGLIRGSFRLAGQNELSNRLTLIQIGGSSSSPTQPTDEPAPTDGSSDESSEDAVSEADPTDPSSAGPTEDPAEPGEPG